MAISNLLLCRNLQNKLKELLILWVGITKKHCSAARVVMLQAPGVLEGRSIGDYCDNRYNLIDNLLDVQIQKLESHIYPSPS